MSDEDDRGDWDHDVEKDKELDRRWEEEAQRQRDAVKQLHGDIFFVTLGKTFLSETSATA